MSSSLTPFVAFTIGLFSTLHCVGMCGGIVGALSFSLPAEVTCDKSRLLLFSLAYNTGRILSYTLAGALLGGIGYFFLESLAHSAVHRILPLLGGIVMFLIGLELSLQKPLLARLEIAGKAVWQRLEPLGRRFLPLRSLPHAFLFGIIWGWLPCGIVYSILLLSAVGGGAWQGGMVMLGFGLGTLPAMLSLGMLSGFLARLRSNFQVRRILGFFLMIFALAYLGWHFQ